MKLQLILLSLWVHLGLSELDCKKAKLTVNFIKNCDEGKHIITILENSTMTMDENCDFHTNMCSSLIEYQHAFFEMAIFKNGKKTFDDKIDVCNSGKKAAEIMVIGLAAFSVPTVCPIVSNYTSCGNGKRIFTHSKASLRVAEILLADGGLTRITADIVHDTGKSCMEAEFKLSME